MNVHKNARLTPRGRERIVLQVESGQTLEAVAQAVGVCPRTVRKWVDRYRREGLAGLLKARRLEAHVIHAGSVAVSREHRRAKTDRLDAELLKRAFLGWLRGERNHCKVVAIPTLKDEDANALAASARASSASKVG